ncbi:MAG: NrfD/PsrC family molybdoenzyme membrane anchor subunit [Mycobacterium leprae]
MKLGRWKPDAFKSGLLVLFLVAIAISVYRLFVPLSAFSNIDDQTPFGLWKAWDVIVVVPMGAAGFTMAFVRYWANDARYEMIERRSVIWAALCYISMGARLMIDLGHPFRIVYPLVFWGNIHSPLFEVAWCVFLYLIVLFFENLPRLTERFPGEKAAYWSHKLHHSIVPWFALAGILLSSMHQSSLGSLYLAVGKRIDPLWYHPWLNYIFLLTAVAMGLSFTILIEAFTAKYYKTKFETGLLANLGVAIAAALSVAFVWRIGSMIADGSIGGAFKASANALLWWLENITLYVLPLIVLWQKKLRNNAKWLVGAAASVAFGAALFRMNVALTGMAADMKSSYVPSFTEFLFSVGWTAGIVGLFTLFAEFLPGMLGEKPVYEESVGHVVAADD